MFFRIGGNFGDILIQGDDIRGEGVESYATKRWDLKAALKFLRKSIMRYARPQVIVTDKLCS